MRALLGGFSGLLAMCLLIPSGIGAAITETKLTASDAAADKFFGWSVAISGDIVVVSSPGKVRGPVGSAYVFQRSGGVWSQQAKLIAGDASGFDLLGANLDFFGASAALDSDTIVVGATRANDAAGSAYVFVHNGTTWTLQSKLSASNAQCFSAFGSSVALSGDTVVIGARRHNDDLGSAGAQSGSVYVFQRSGPTWAQQAKLTANDGAAGDLFGNSVAISGGITIVGAPGDDGAGIDSGSAYVFVRSGTSWHQQMKLTASDAAAEDFFGAQDVIAIDGKTVVVGALSKYDAGTDSGSAYVYELSKSVKAMPWLQLLLD